MKNNLKKLFVILFAISLSPMGFAQDPNDSVKVKSLENRINALEKRITLLERLFYQNLAQQKGFDTINPKQKEKARERIKKDSEKYSAEELRDAEDLYQKGSDVINSPESKKFFRELINKYPLMNRAGCAALYIAQNEKGPEQEKLLLDVIEKYSDCYYLDGVQVGPYARHYLANFYFENKNLKKGQAEYDYIKANYPDAIDHKGKKLLLERKD